MALRREGCRSIQTRFNLGNTEVDDEEEALCSLTAEIRQVAFCFTIAVVLFAAIVFYTEEHVEAPWGQPFEVSDPMCACAWSPVPVLSNLTVVANE
jgi:hypothetical protein